MKNNRGVTLIEILVSMLLIAVASVAAYGAFSYAKGNIVRQGNLRAAAEQARGRLEQLMAANCSSTNPPDGTSIKPQDENVRWLTCSGNPCTWTLSTTQAAETVSVNGVGNLRMETTVQATHDPSAGTDPAALDVLAFSAKVWVVPGSTDDDFHRVEIRTLRTPSS